MIMLLCGACSMDVLKCSNLAGNLCRLRSIGGCNIIAEAVTTFSSALRDNYMRIRHGVETLIL